MMDAPNTRRPAKHRLTSFLLPLRRRQTVWLVMLFLYLATAYVDTSAQDQLIVVVGAGGEDVYAQQFATSAGYWLEMARRNSFDRLYIGPNQESFSAESALQSQFTTDKQRLESVISTADAESDDALWIVMLGHGTFQQGIANFNLQGPDVSADEMAQWLDRFQRPLVLIHAFSSSGPWLGKMSKNGRIIVTATRSGDEQNYTRFGNFLSRTINHLDADIDHDLNVSVLEAFLKAAADTKQFYETEGRLQTEHPLIDDNGDRVGTPPSFFRGVRIVQQAANNEKPDGQLSARKLVLRDAQLPEYSLEQRARITQLEQQIEELRTRKSGLSEDKYFAELEVLMIELARIELAHIELAHIEPQPAHEVQTQTDP